MKINVDRDGGLVIASADGSISFLSGAGQFAIQTSRICFGYKRDFYSPGEFFFLDMKMWWHREYKSEQRARQSLIERGLLPPEVFDLPSNGTLDQLWHFLKRSLGIS
jgi:hypothetical protein